MFCIKKTLPETEVRSSFWNCRRLDCSFSLPNVPKYETLGRFNSLGYARAWPNLAWGRYENFARPPEMRCVVEARARDAFPSQDATEGLCETRDLVSVGEL